MLASLPTLIVVMPPSAKVASPLERRQSRATTGGALGVGAALGELVGAGEAVGLAAGGAV
jgi:hypothetical protein